MADGWYIWCARCLNHTVQNDPAYSKYSKEKTFPINKQDNATPTPDPDPDRQAGSW